jgi:P-type Ca2+ transporter type 2C
VKPFYQLTKDEILSELKTSEQGLKNTDISTLQNKFGKNILEETKQKANWQYCFLSLRMS